MVLDAKVNTPEVDNQTLRNDVRCGRYKEGDEKSVERHEAFADLCLQLPAACMRVTQIMGSTP